MTSLRNSHNYDEAFDSETQLAPRVASGNYATKRSFIKRFVTPRGRVRTDIPGSSAVGGRAGSTHRTPSTRSGHQKNDA